MLKRFVLVPVACDHVRGCTATASAQGRIAHGFRHLGMTRKPEIVVAAEIHDALPVDDDLCAAVVQREGLHATSRTPQVLPFDVGKRVLQSGGIPFHEWRELLDQALAASEGTSSGESSGSAAMPRRAKSCRSCSSSGLPVVSSLSP